MRVAVVNEASDPRIARASLERIVGALRRQAEEHYAPFWQSAAVPAYAAANSATLRSEAAEFLRDCRRAVTKREAAGGQKVSGSMARGTLEMYEQKIGNLLAVMAPSFRSRRSMQRA